MMENGSYASCIINHLFVIFALPPKLEQIMPNEMEENKQIENFPSDVRNSSETSWEIRTFAMTENVNRKSETRHEHFPIKLVFILNNSFASSENSSSEQKLRTR